MASYYFNKIELKHECDPDLQFCDSVLNFESTLPLHNPTRFEPYPDPTLIHAPINLKLEFPILQSHILLMENECKPQLFYLDPTLDPISTLEPLLDLNQFPKSILVPLPFNPELKSTISPNHIQLLN